MFSTRDKVTRSWSTCFSSMASGHHDPMHFTGVGCTLKCSYSLIFVRDQAIKFFHNFGINPVRLNRHSAGLYVSNLRSQTGRPGVLPCNRLFTWDVTSILVIHWVIGGTVQQDGFWTQRHRPCGTLRHRGQHTMEKFPKGGRQNGFMPWEAAVKLRF